MNYLNKERNIQLLFKYNNKLKIIRRCISFYKNSNSNHQPCGILIITRDPRRSKTQELTVDQNVDVLTITLHTSSLIKIKNLTRCLKIQIPTTILFRL